MKRAGSRRDTLGDSPARRQRDDIRRCSSMFRDTTAAVARYYTCARPAFKTKLECISANTLDTAGMDWP